jgi:hypothetical protein
MYCHVLRACAARRCVPVRSSRRMGTRILYILYALAKSGRRTEALNTHLGDAGEIP